ncbi:hypothetical protein BS17DRAFT_428288 [Gyrodon lividus]|nr:hypothetical protein BS17DRAFT_428288 [Gyrodon lividus]
MHCLTMFIGSKVQSVQPFIIPIPCTFCSFACIAVTSGGIQLYGEVLWGPMLFIDKWVNRAAAFFASFTFPTIGTNISANSLGAWNGMIVLLPNYVNIRRGQIFCAFIGSWALCPWEVLANSEGFLSFVNGYTIFLGHFPGIMVTDVRFLEPSITLTWSLSSLPQFWLLHKGKVDVLRYTIPTVDTATLEDS